MLRVGTISKNYETSEVRTHALSDVSLTVGEANSSPSWGLRAAAASRPPSRSTSRAARPSRRRADRIARRG